MKKLIALALAFSLVGCNGASNSTQEESTVAESTEIEQTNMNDDISKDLDSIGDIEVENKIFDVTITLPAEYVGDATQESLDEDAKEIGYKVTLNDDGSATYTMTKDQHKQMMDNITNSINESLSEMVGSEEFPNFTDIKANDDFTIFTITTTSTKLSLAESISTLGFYMYGGVYNIFNGTPVENIHVDFVNADSGDIISSADSSEAGK